MKNQRRRNIYIIWKCLKIMPSGNLKEINYVGWRAAAINISSGEANKGEKRAASIEIKHAGASLFQKSRRLHGGPELSALAARALMRRSVSTRMGDDITSLAQLISLILEEILAINVKVIVKRVTLEVIIAIINQKASKRSEINRKLKSLTRNGWQRNARREAYMLKAIENILSIYRRLSHLCITLNSGDSGEYGS